MTTNIIATIIIAVTTNISPMRQVFDWYGQSGAWMDIYPPSTECFYFAGRFRDSPDTESVDVRRTTTIIFHYGGEQWQAVIRDELVEHKVRKLPRKPK